MKKTTKRLTAVVLSLTLVLSTAVISNHTKSQAAVPADAYLQVGAYLYQNGAGTGTLPKGVTYDPATNVLSVTDGKATSIYGTRLGSDFTIKVSGTCTADHIELDDGCSLTITGSGTLSVDATSALKDLPAEESAGHGAIEINAYDGNSTVTITDGVTVIATNPYGYGFSYFNSPTADATGKLSLANFDTSKLQTKERTFSSGRISYTLYTQTSFVAGGTGSAVTKIKLNKSKATLKKGKKLTLKATVTPAGAGATLAWKSSNKKVAKVSSTGKVTAVKKGKCTITCSAGGKKATCKITVK